VVRRRRWWTAPADADWRLAVRSAWLREHGVLGYRGRLRAHLRFYGAPAAADLDNLAKGVLDALQAVGWRDGLAPAMWDDRQVRWLLVEALPVQEGAGPGVLITLAPWPEPRGSSRGAAARRQRQEGTGDTEPSTSSTGP
jgi:hypothetical protein